MRAYRARVLNMETCPSAQSSNLCEAEVICSFIHKGR